MPTAIEAFCHKCGTQLSNDSSFCPKCGAQAIIPDAPLDFQTAKTVTPRASLKPLFLILAVSLGVVVIAVAYLRLTAEGSSDWGMWRADAANTGAVANGPEPPLKLLWTEKSSGVSVMASGIVYVAEKDKDSNRFQLYALDADTGVRKWNSRIANFNSFMAVSGGFLYVNGMNKNCSTGKLYALNTASGTKKWSSELTGIPTVAGESVYVFGGRLQDINRQRYRLYALNAATGIEKWSSHITNNSATIPAVSGSTVYVTGTNEDDNRERLYALDAGTGAEKWSSEIGSSGIPLVSGRLVYVIGTDKNSPEERLYALDAMTGAEKWRSDTSVTGVPSVAGGIVYVASKGKDGYQDGLYALDAMTGAEKWRSDIGSEIASVSSGIVYVTDRDEASGFRLYALDALTGAERWHSQPLGTNEGAVAISGRTVAVNTAQKLFVFGEKH